MTRPTPLRILFFFVLAAILIALAHGCDRYVLSHWHSDAAHGAEWAKLFRAMGYLPGWLILSVAFILIDIGRPRTAPLSQFWARGALLSGSALLAGLVAMGIKLTLRRTRPFSDESLFYAFRPFAEKSWTTSGLGMPSSHTTVAFGAAFMLCRFHPAASPVWLVMATGCAATRVFTQAHFLSDVVAAIFVGYAVAWGFWHLHTAVHHRELYRRKTG